MGLTPRRASRNVEDPAWLFRRVSVMSATIVVGALIAQRVEFLIWFNGRFTDPDQAILWYATREVLHFHFHTPFFYGQTYASWFEAIPAAPLRLLHVPIQLAVPLSTHLLAVGCWGQLAWVAWRRRHTLFAVACLAIPVALTRDYTMLTSMPRGFLPGIFLAVTACSVVLVRRHPGALRLGAFAALAIVALSQNQGSIVVTAPVAVHVLCVIWPDWRRLAGAFAGTFAGAVIFFMEHEFIDRHPNLVVQDWFPATVRWSTFVENVGRLSSFFSDYSPWFWDSAIPVLAVFAIVVAGSLFTRRARFVLPALSLVVLSALLLAVGKVADGTDAIQRSFSRFYVGLPFSLCLLTLLVRDVSPQRTSARTVAIGSAALATTAVISVAWPTPGLAAAMAAEAQAPVQPMMVSVDDVLDSCSAYRTMANTYGVSLVVFLSNLSEAYGCPAVAHDEPATLYPLGERRAWLFEAEAIRPRSRVLVAGGPPDWCRFAPTGVECVVVPGPKPVNYLLNFPSRPVVELMEKMGSVRR